MAQKPDKFPDWATEEEIDEVSGQANFVEPPDFRKESGWTRREIPPRQWFNWLARKTGLWFRWVEEQLDPGTTPFLQRSNNLSDLNNASTGRDNLGLGSASVEDDIRYAHRANNLADLDDASAGRDNLGVPYASEVESLAGEAEDRVIAPARFGDQSLTTNGYQVLPGGLIIQWGVVENTTQTNESVTFPVEFNNAVLSISTERSIESPSGDGLFSTISWDYSLSGFILRNTGSSASDIYWIAIGY